MQVTVRGRNLEISDSLRTLAEARLKKLERFVDDLTELEVELARESARSGADRNKVDVKLSGPHGLTLNAQSRGADVRMALDAVCDVLQRQIVRHKERLQSRGRAFGSRSAAALAGPDVAPASAEPAEPDEESYHAVVTVPYETKPKTLEEALDQARLSNRLWSMYLSADTQQVHVIERQSDGTFVEYVPVPE